ncbi:MAG: alpha/beta hydrolase [Desulfuromonadales bacterium]|nr:alpha/beta hydrolase [Desulfuromonadales bacterium]
MKADINGTTIEYEIRGNGDPLLLIHGFPLSRKIWEPQLSGLSDQYMVIAPNLRGYGESPLPFSDYKMDTYSDDLVALLDSLKIEKAIVGGMSMGGYILFNMIDRYPKRVKAAIFMVTTSDADSEEGKKRRQMLADLVLTKGTKPVADAFKEILFAPDTKTEHPELVESIYEQMLTTSPEGIINGLFAMRDRKEYTSRLFQFKLPSLIICARLDQTIPREKSLDMLSKMPNATLYSIPDAGHMVGMEQPEKVNQEIRNFISNLQ